MTSGGPKDDQIKSLISGALSPSSSSDAPTSEAPKADENATDLIEIYFELDEPMERDTLLDQLLAIETEEVTRFLEEMAHQDEDPYLRSTAAAELCRRGKLDFEAILRADFDDPNEPELFAQAAAALANLHGSAFYDTLKTAWGDAQRDPAQREEALLAMEALDSPRTLGVVDEALSGLQTLDGLDDEFLEQAALLFARHDYERATAIFEQLGQHASALEPAARADLLSLLEEAQSLFIREGDA